MSSPHRAKRSLGQNFLVDPNLQRKIASALQAEPGDAVLEIGPGRGALTQHLAKLGVRLWAVELDDELAADLEATYSDDPDVTVLHRDVLKVAFPTVIPAWPEARVIGNIPYNITTPILFHLLESPRPRDIVLMVQAEVGDRIVATPGSKTYGALAVGVQTVARAQRLFKVPPKAFRPVPKVDSVVVRITPIVPEPLSRQDVEEVRRLTRALFQWRRKQLQTTLRKHGDLGYSAEESHEALSVIGVEPATRPESLHPEQFVSLAKALTALR